MKLVSFRALATATCLSLLFCMNICGQDTNELLVKNIYPGASLWFEKMTQKYPEAQLQNVLFYVSDHYHSDTGSIYWPVERLKAINTAYINTENQNNLLDIDTFKQDEYILLHEAAHVLKNHNMHGYAAIVLTGIAFAALNGYLTIKTFMNPQANFLTWQQGLVLSIIGNSIALTSLLIYIKTQEQEADNFANQYADKSALQAGIDYFDTCVKQDQKLAIFTQKLLELSEPSISFRKQAIKASLASRFATEEDPCANI